MIDPQIGLFATSAISVALNCAFGIYVLARERHKAVKSDIENVDHKLNRLRERQTELETVVSHLPRVEALQQISDAVGSLRADLKGVSAQVQSVQNQTNLIDSYMRQAGHMSS